MLIDVSKYRVVYGETVLNALAIISFIFSEDKNTERRTIRKPDFLVVMALNEDGNVILIEDETWRFQFIPRVGKGE